jgi:hypothetical protein
VTTLAARAPQETAKAFAYAGAALVLSENCSRPGNLQDLGLVLQLLIMTDDAGMAFRTPSGAIPTSAPDWIANIGA